MTNKYMASCLRLVHKEGKRKGGGKGRYGEELRKRERKREWKEVGERKKEEEVGVSCQTLTSPRS